jgi:hypothetical protein
MRIAGGTSGECALEPPGCGACAPSAGLPFSVGSTAGGGAGSVTECSSLAPFSRWGSVRAVLVDAKQYSGPLAGLLS